MATPLPEASEIAKAAVLHTFESFGKEDRNMYTQSSIEDSSDSSEEDEDTVTTGEKASDTSTSSNVLESSDNSQYPKVGGDLTEKNNNGLSEVGEQESVPVEDVDTTPTFEDLAIDDTLTELEKLTRYAQSNIALQRLVQVKEISTVASKCTTDEVLEEIIPLIEPLSEDAEYIVRMKVAEEITPLAKLLIRDRGQYDIVLESLLPVVNRLLSEEGFADVRFAAGSTLIALARLIKPGDVSVHVLMPILHLAHDDDADLRVVAPSLLDRLALHLDPELCHQFVVPELISLSGDTNYRVRKACALNLRNTLLMCNCKPQSEDDVNQYEDVLLENKIELEPSPNAWIREVDEEKSTNSTEPPVNNDSEIPYNKNYALLACMRKRQYTFNEKGDALFQAYLKLCDDEKWVVRKGCTESITAISRICTLKVRLTILVPTYLKFLRDSSKWIRLKAFADLGMFLSTLPGWWIGISKIAIKAHSLNITNYRPYRKHYHDDDGNEVIDLKEEDGSELSTSESKAVNNLQHDCLALALDSVSSDPKLVTSTEMVPNDSVSASGSLLVDTSPTSMTANNLSTVGSPSIGSPIVRTLAGTSPTVGSTFAKKMLSLSPSSVSESAGSASKSLNFLSGGNTGKKKMSEVRKSKQKFHGGNLHRSKLSPEQQIKSDTADLLDFYVGMGYCLHNSTLTRPDGHKKSSSGNMIPEYLQADSRDTVAVDSAYGCAFTFPSVLFTLGRDRWIELSTCFGHLEKAMNWRIRRSLAYSLHTIAKILGPSLSESYVLRAFDQFLQDVDEVKIGIVKSLGHFLLALGPSCRESYLPVMSDVMTETPSMQWRFRLHLASQIGSLSQTFSIAATFSVISPLVFHLLNDPVCVVRKESMNGVGTLICRLAKDAPQDEKDAWVEDFLGKLVQFTKNPSSVHRRDFVYLSEKLLLHIPPEVFAKYVRHPLLELCKDAIANVRLAVANMIRNICQLPDKALASSRIKMLNEASKSQTSVDDQVGSLSQALKRLEQDKDQEICYVITEIRNQLLSLDVDLD